MACIRVLAAIAKVMVKATRCTWILNVIIHICFSFHNCILCYFFNMQLHYVTVLFFFSSSALVLILHYLTFPFIRIFHPRNGIFLWFKFLFQLSFNSILHLCSPFFFFLSSALSHFPLFISYSIQFLVLLNVSSVS